METKKTVFKSGSNYVYIFYKVGLFNMGLNGDDSVLQRAPSGQLRTATKTYFLDGIKRARTVYPLGDDSCAFSRATLQTNRDDCRNDKQQLGSPGFSVKP